MRVLLWLDLDWEMKTMWIAMTMTMTTTTTTETETGTERGRLKGFATVLLKLPSAIYYHYYLFDWILVFIPGQNKCM